ncbi:hypothetical protein [Methylobacterium aquaticum]|uniref:hypothetical protein n=1 Tax=Methylobacterium aquaticum TaxID=270351 RepID=UPI001931C08A|nr:hypothetical protein [Methylobacterium aquaticum]QRE75502.1 hypothetical protein F1D61_19630 [Methylobacterium aquaticum]
MRRVSSSGSGARPAQPSGNPAPADTRPHKAEEWDAIHGAFAKRPDTPHVRALRFLNATGEPRAGIGFSVTFTAGRKERLLLPVADLDMPCGTIVPAPPGFMVFEVCIPSVAEAACGSD